MSVTENLPAARKGVAVDMSGPITDLDQAWRVATMLALADALPRALRGKPANVLVVLLTGQELGLTPLQAMRTVFVPPSGLPGIRGELLLAKLREAGHDYTWEEGERSCTFTITRGDNRKSYTGRFTLDDAKQARLVTEKDGQLIARSGEGKALPWEQYRSDMLFWRAVARAVRRGAPEVTYGFTIREAAEEEEPQPVELAPQAPPAAPTETPGAAAEVAVELARLNAPPDARPDPNQPGVGGQPPGPQASPEPPAAEAERVPPPPTEAPRHKLASNRQLAEVMARFAALGWDDVNRYRGDLLDACTKFTRRPVTSAAQLTGPEATRLQLALAGIEDKHDPAHYPVALADAVESWRQDWEAEDPASYHLAGMEK